MDDLLAGRPLPDGGVDSPRQGARDLEDGLALGFDLLEVPGQAEPLLRIAQVQRVGDLDPVQLLARRRIEVVPYLDAVAEGGQAILGRITSARSTPARFSSLL